MRVLPLRIKRVRNLHPIYITDRRFLVSYFLHLFIKETSRLWTLCDRVGTLVRIVVVTTVKLLPTGTVLHYFNCEMET